MERIRSLPAILYQRKIDVGVVLVWSVSMSVMLMLNFLTFYQVEQFTMAAWNSPAFAPIEIIILAIVGLIATIIISDVKRVIFGYFTSMALIYIISTLAVFVYIWSVRELGLALGEIPYGWEIALFSAVVKVFGFMFPIGFIFSLIGVVAGTVISFVVRNQ
jgi:hypothetical protein